MTKPKLKLHQALDLLRRKDARMVQTNGQNGNRTEYWMWPACVRIEPKLAEAIKLHPQVIGSKDGMWPGHDQTWRMRGE
jgi:hypothetical protein